MITVTRRQCRRLRAVFRRHALGIAHKGPVPPLVFRADPGSGLRVRHHQPALAIEHVLPGTDRPEEAIALPLDALADFEGRDDTPVVLEAVTPGRTVVRWDDRGIPQSRDYPVPDLAGLPPFPAPPAVTESCPAGLLDALAEAAATTDEGSTRYALDCLQLRGDTGEVVATDGRQILIQGGFRLPWAGDLLVRRIPLFASRELPRDRPVEVGRADAHVVLRAGPWAIWLAIRADARFPRIERALLEAQAAATRLRLDPEDAAFLGRALDRLPGGDALHAPVTVDLNGQVTVRARAEGGDRVTELVLGSGFAGEPIRLSTSRHYLARAVRLGFAEIEVVRPDDPVACRDDRRAYLWQPLSRESAIGPSDDAIRIDSTAAASDGGRAEPRKEEDVIMVHPVPDPRPDGAAPGATPGTANAVTTEAAGGLAALIREAEALHEALADARARAGRLTVALRRYRRRERLVSSTLASLKALKLQEVAG